MPLEDTDVFVIRVRLRKPRRVWDYRCADMAIPRDTPCLVEGESGLEWGVCVLPPEPVPPEIGNRIRYQLVRMATDDDLLVMNEIEIDEPRILATCREKVEAHKLPMRLVDAEISFDRKKITVFFTAENRVDFRELVRDLVREFHKRIELRHIQIRDQAKIAGGIGVCGRTLCCCSWMDEFFPVSMRMAKCQNLSLNPGKISGQCGRLLCCLAYEAETYGYKGKGVIRVCANACTARETAEEADDDLDDSDLPSETGN